MMCLSSEFCKINHLRTKQISMFQTFLGATVDTTTHRTSMHNRIAGDETVETHVWEGPHLDILSRGPRVPSYATVSDTDLWTEALEFD